MDRGIRREAMRLQLLRRLEALRPGVARELGQAVQPAALLPWSHQQ